MRTDRHLKNWTAKEQQQWKDRRIEEFEKESTRLAEDKDVQSSEWLMQLQTGYAQELNRMFDDRIGFEYVNHNARGEMLVPAVFFSAAIWPRCKAKLHSQGRKPHFFYRHIGSWAERTFSFVVLFECSVSVLMEIFGPQPFRARRFNTLNGPYNDDPTQGPLAGGLLQLGETVKWMEELS
eukprot:TRINITY_DN11420_c0_g1_i2.p1 TRINITY_DN11420_c0_g1~~TRINITY_DN11420_c0_g1_i2.p1  ORF type:complete len:180 (+),score=29.44 TRINITY_DN11420_c0_g1_i2:134-673(+)